MAEAGHQPDVVGQLLKGSVPYLLVDHQLCRQPSRERLLVFPGAFNPLHSGHRDIAALASERLKLRVAFELSVENVDKPRLTSTDVRRRLRQFSPNELVYLTKAATFVEKAVLFKDTCFLAGVDTIDRIADVRYYDNQLAARDLAIQTIAQRGCSFLVFGRLIERAFCTLDELDLPESLRAICTGFDEGEFRVDLSSTQLRQSSR